MPTVPPPRRSASPTSTARFLKVFAGHPPQWLFVRNRRHVSLGAPRALNKNSYTTSITLNKDAFSRLVTLDATRVHETSDQICVKWNAPVHLSSPPPQPVDQQAILVRHRTALWRGLQPVPGHSPWRRVTRRRSGNHQCGRRGGGASQWCFSSEAIL